MMYANKFAAAVMVDGNILKEHNGEVSIPFGSEYSIYMKNLNSKGVGVNISIDGEDLGYMLYISENSAVNFETFFRDQHKFKFIEKTEQISEYRGDRVDDGLIRLEYRFKKDFTPASQWVHSDNWQLFGDNSNSKRYGGYWITTSASDRTACCDNFAVNLTSAAHVVKDGTAGPMSCNYSSSSVVDNNDAGITVKGSKSNQHFTTISGIEFEDTSYVMIFHLKGFKEDLTYVEKPILSRQKITCPTCGKVNKNYANYCINCGTCLSD